MHLELVELLRCAVPHQQTVLVALAEQVEARYIMEGALGCPVCGAEYAIVNGVTRLFVQTQSDRNVDEQQPYDRRSTSSRNAATSSNALANGARNDQGADTNESMALAAQLSLREGRSVFAVIGFSLRAIQALRLIIPARMLVVNPTELAAPHAQQPSGSPPESVTESIRASIGVAPFGVISADSFPVINERLDGIAITESFPPYMPDLARALRVRGRLVAPVSSPLPAGMRELVRDESVWVAEREPVASSPISLQPRSRAT